MTATQHSAHRPAGSNARGSAANNDGNGHPRCLAVELPARAAGARGAFWTEERDAVLIRLWRQAEPYVTAVGIGDLIGTSKNAVLGRARRLSLPPRSEILHTEVLSRADAHAKRAADAAKLRELVKQGYTVRAAGAQIGMGRARAADLAREFDIHASAKTLARVRLAKRMETLRSRSAGPCTNPFLTPAQQANVGAMKTRTWHLKNPRLMAMPPPTAEEAARLVAEHIARHGVTQCPGAVVVEPSNAGAGFR